MQHKNIINPMKQRGNNYSVKENMNTIKQCIKEVILTLDAEWGYIRPGAIVGTVTILRSTWFTFTLTTRVVTVWPPLRIITLCNMT